MNTFRSWLLHVYFLVRNSWPIWYGILNRDPRKRYSNHRPVLNEVQARILDDLRRDGIAFSTIDDLFPREGLLPNLQSYMNAKGKIGGHHRKKKFLESFWDERDTFGLDNPFFALAVRKEILDIVNSYDAMWRRFNHMHLQETIPVGDASPTQSQRWHRDPQEKRQVKFFMYLSDVDDEAGPFTYVKGSQFGSPRYGHLFPQSVPLGSYPPIGAVEGAVNQKDIVSATGKAGTIIFCDTAGLHRGGYARSKSRFMFTAFYPSKKWTEPRFYGLDPSVTDFPLSEESRFALGIS